jgi:hypothetical protein
MPLEGIDSRWGLREYEKPTLLIREVEPVISSGERQKHRGSRKFYWDTVFIPEDASGRSQGLTYAEIVEDANLGLAYKMRELSQSSAAMKSFLEYRLTTGDPELWR